MKLVSTLANLVAPSANHVSYPFAKILVNGLDVTTKFAPLLIHMNIEDVAGIESDSVTFTLANPKGNIFVPPKGAKIGVMMGYEKSAMINMGLYELGTISLSGGANQTHQIAFTAKAAHFHSNSIKNPRNQSFDKKTLSEIIQKIAGDNGLIPTIGKDLTSVKIEHIDQINESDMHFLTRLSIDYDAIFKIAQKRLIFVKRGKGLSATGKALKSLQIHLTPKISYKLYSDDKESFDKFIVYYQDKDKGGRSKAEAGKGEKTYEYQRTLPSKEEAETKAQSLLNQQARWSFKLELTMPGMPSLTAETPIIIVEPSIPLLSGRWIIEKVSHNLSPSGFTSSVFCYPDTDEAHSKLKKA